MIVALAVLVPLLLLAMFVYVRFRPLVDQNSRSAVWIFDSVVVALIVAVDSVLTVHFKTTTGQSVDSAWWPVLAVLSCLFIDAVVLFLAALIRGLVFGRKENRGRF